MGKGLKMLTGDKKALLIVLARSNPLHASQNAEEISQVPLRLSKQMTSR